LQPAISRHGQNLSGHSKAANRYAKIKTQIASRKMLPIMLSVPLLQAVAPAYVHERDRKKANRRYYEHDVQHEQNLRKRVPLIAVAFRTSPGWTYQ
jgi:hypothetical protein